MQGNSVICLNFTFKFLECHKKDTGRVQMGEVTPRRQRTTGKQTEVKFVSTGYPGRHLECDKDSKGTRILVNMSGNARSEGQTSDFTAYNDNLSEASCSSRQYDASGDTEIEFRPVNVASGVLRDLSGFIKVNHTLYSWTD